MKKTSLLLKYSALYFISLLLIIIILAKLIDVTNITLFSIIIISILLYTVSLFFIYKEIILPVKNLYKFSKRLKHEGENEGKNNFDYKIEELNDMLNELESHIRKSIKSKEISDVANELYSVTERTLFELKTAKLFKVNRNEFLGNVAHELRTPIFAIQLSLETLLDGAINDEKVNLDFLRKASNQTKRLKDLVDDLISISKFETGVKMSKRYFKIDNMLKKTIEELKPLADNKNILFEVDLNDTTGVSVFGDEERLNQVMVNLIDNAIKYTDENGRIKTGVLVNEKDVTVFIEDTGMGISKKNIARIFERFYRVDEARSRDVGGSGLGLSIVKHILEAHSSRIKVESELNKGTRIEFNLQR
jgi:two-component system, OmpR family, phosphate regulon sensor histidine kinase PhoR